MPYNKIAWTAVSDDEPVTTVATRNQLTDEWQRRNVQGREYGILTNEIHQGTFDNMSVKAHKELKGLPKEIYETT